jgi:hypothetical protein
MGLEDLDRRFLFRCVTHIDPQQQSAARELLLYPSGMMAVDHAAK